MTKHDENAYLREAVIGLQSKLAEYVHKYEQAIYELELVYREREAAINDLRDFLKDMGTDICPLFCDYCKWNNTCEANKTPEWRGIQEDASCAT
jgi:hypothetical protein